MLYRFEFQDHSIVHNYVSDEAGIQLDVIVSNRQWHLPLEGHRCSSEFVAEAFFVDRLEQPWAETPVHTHREADNPVGQIATGGAIMFHHVTPAPRCIDEP